MKDNLLRQIYVRGLILQTIYGMGSVSKEITVGVCFSGETAIATGGKAGERGVSSLVVAI